jgi:hypothetical protein
VEIVVVLTIGDLVSFIEQYAQLANVDLFAEMRKPEESPMVGRPFYLDFDTLRLLSNDHWKRQAHGVPAGTFLLCSYANAADDVDEAVLVRVLAPTPLPSDSDIVAAMVDYYKEGDSSLDQYTRSEFQFSGLECRVLGTFYREGNTVLFGGDIENFESPHNYLCVKPSPRLLEYIVNFREGGVVSGTGNIRIGSVRYSASRRLAAAEPEVPVFVSTYDFLGKRTALFGMTRTGKSNSVKKIVQATRELIAGGSATLDGQAVQPIGQIIFDINGEYANANQQDDGTAIFEQYEDATRYSVQAKPGFRTMKLNFHRSIAEGHSLLASLLSDDTAGYTRAFRAIVWEVPDAQDHSATTRYERRVACYRACLHAAGFSAGNGSTVRFQSSNDIRKSGIAGLGDVDPHNGISLDDAAAWFSAVWENYDKDPFAEYKASHGGREWADEDLKTLMQFLTRRAQPGQGANELGFRKLAPHRGLHTPSVGESFERDIVNELRAGGIVIVDLSQGNPRVQRTFTDGLCRAIFDDAMRRFVSNEAANFVQMYFEEAHNLFPRRNETDLTLIYNRLAKEGQKLRLGLVYATQEVSSISASILKNTQNWFVSHLNNREELREVEKYYDFGDFTDSLRRTNDKGFIRLKTDSNTFIVPIQVDRFQVPFRVAAAAGPDGAAPETNGVAHDGA